MLPTKFQFFWESGFRGEDHLEINQSKTRMAYGGHTPPLNPPLNTHLNDIRIFLFFTPRGVGSLFVHANY
jgi:hypothetical protein